MKLKKIVEYLRDLHHFSGLGHPCHSINKVLVSLDIDETILFFEELDTKWWTDTTANHTKILETRDKAKKQVLVDWQKLIGVHKPKMVDFENFNTILQSCLENENVDIVFVTARDKGIADVTLQHFEHLGIPTHLPIVFCASSNKGIALIKYIVYIESKDHKYNNVIFADDLQRNIDDVEKEFRINAKDIILKTFLIE